MPGEGLYLQTRDDAAYLSSDLQEFRRVDSFPNDEDPDWANSTLAANPRVWANDAAYSADGRLVAFPVDNGQNRMPEIQVFSGEGEPHRIAAGKAPSGVALRNSGKSDCLGCDAPELACIATINEGHPGPLTASAGSADGPAFSVFLRA